MRACIYRRFGGPDVLNWVDDWPVPACGPSQVLVRMDACSVNPKDSLLRSGAFGFPIDRRRLPRGTGLDGVGNVEAVGNRVTDVAPGDRVMGMTNRFAGGVLAELAVFESDELVRCPPSLSITAAAACPLVSLTALQALRDLCRVTVGQRVLVIGASGGVGHCAVQIARRLGAEVHATASAPHHDWVAQLGATQVLDHHQQQISAVPTRYDAVFDVSGRYQRRQLTNQLAAGGVFVSTVPTARAITYEVAARMRLPCRSRLVIVRSNADDLACIAGWLAAGELTICVHATFDAADIGAAHEQIQTGHTPGKLVVHLG